MTKSKSQPEPPTTKATPAKRAPEPSGKDAAKETFESIVIAFVLAFAFRAYVVEAFVIPTGSMAPTLLGAHATLTCPQCGYTHVTDWPYYRSSTSGDQIPMPLDQPRDTPCPMCKYPITLPIGSLPCAGDRILVHKYIYSVSQPRRWDVVVFKNPQLRNGDGTPGPTTNYIKRLVGLPGEDLLVIEGNVYVRRPESENPAEQQWHIARKTDRPEAQNAVWQPIYHSAYVPLDGGFTEGQARARWRVPWEPTGDRDHWSLPAQEDHAPAAQSIKPGENAYYFDSSARGELRFNFPLMLPSPFQGGYISHEYPYNIYHGRGGEDPIEDVRLAVTLRPQGPGLSVLLRTEARLDAKPAEPGGGDQEIIAARITADGKAELLRAPKDRAAAANDPPQYTVIESANLAAISPDRTTDVEFWFVDQEAVLLVNGEQVLSHRFETPFEQVFNRPPLQFEAFPTVAIEVEGSPVTLYNVDLDRDTYYTARSENGGGASQGVIDKDDYGRFRQVDVDRAAVHLYHAKPGDARNSEFFCMGDNSPSSSDGRFWTQIDPWIKHNMFADIHRPGVVPEEVMMGRAFFVYFPAPLRYTPTSWGIIVNFGHMRFIH